MLSPDQIDFYNRWKAKADAILYENVAEYIDKYVTLFILYNSLYVITVQKLSDRGIAVGDGDKAGATKAVISFLGAEEISSNLEDTGNGNNIANLVKIMHHYNIKLDGKGRPQPEIDEQLKINLLSTDPEVKVLALLEILYYVRCNIIHGQKGLATYQILLLEPVILILNTLNLQLFAKLNAQ